MTPTLPATVAAPGYSAHDGDAPIPVVIHPARAPQVQVPCPIQRRRHPAHAPGLAGYEQDVADFDGDAGQGGAGGYGEARSVEQDGGHGYFSFFRRSTAGKCLSTMARRLAMYSLIAASTIALVETLALPTSAMASPIASNSFMVVSSTRKLTGSVFCGASGFLALAMMPSLPPAQSAKFTLADDSDTSYITDIAYAVSGKGQVENRDDLSMPNDALTERKWFYRRNGTVQWLADRPGFIYLMDAGNGLYKIGRSAHPETRRRALQSERAVSLTLVHAIAVDDMKAAESAAHKLFRPRVVRDYYICEWYRFTPADVRRFKSLTADALCGQGAK